MDAWGDDDFKDKIYNDEYSKADGALPGYENVDIRETISYKNGIRIAELLDGAQGKISILDYGSSGNPGATGLALVDRGFSVRSYDPYFSKERKLPDDRFDFIYLIEVIEHCADVVGVAQFLSSHINAGGLIHIQTLLHPRPAPDGILTSWYIAPRNGHISIFTFEALAILFRRVGLNLVKTLFGLVAFKGPIGFPNKYIL
jgi:hypothetical protein